MSAAGRGRSGRGLTPTRGDRGRIQAKITASVLAALVVLPMSTASLAATPAAARFSAAATSTDVIRGREWWLSALHVTGAWKWSKGRGVTVAVLDTGVDGRHPDLIGQVITGEDYTGRIRRPGNKYWGRHGSAMASIIAGHGHGAGLGAGIMGIAPQAKVLSIRVTWENDDPLRTSGVEADSNRDAVATGIRYAVDHGADVINMSLGGGKLFYNGNPTEEDAIRYALGKGAVLVASAGNDGASANRKNFPAAYPGVIAVGAVDRDLRPWTDSNRHDYVKLAAPGVDVVSADAGGGYVLGTGTSPSAAIVAGIAALIRSRYPRLTSVQVAQAMEKGIVRGAPAGTGSAVGAGVTDAVRALSAANTINKTAYAGTSVRAPLADPQTVPESAGSGLNRLLVGAAAGVAGLLVVWLVSARRRRRRSDEAYDEAYDEYYDEEYDGGHHQRPDAWPGAPGGRSGPVGLGNTVGRGNVERSHPPGADLNGPPPAGHTPPVRVPPWQSTDALAPAPPAAKATERQVWPPPEETMPPDERTQPTLRPPATIGDGAGSGIGGLGTAGRGRGTHGLDSSEPAPGPLDVPAPPPRPVGRRAKGRVNEFRLDFGADPLEQAESPDGQQTAGYPLPAESAVSPDDQQTAAFRVVSPAPDEQPTAAFRAVSPDDQRPAAFRGVPAVPDERRPVERRDVPLVSDEQRTVAFRAVPAVPDERPPPGAHGTHGTRDTHGTPPASSDAPRTVAFRAVPPVPDGRASSPAPSPTSPSPLPPSPFPSSTPPSSATPPAGPPRGAPPMLDEREAAARRAALADRYRRGEITSDEFYAGLAELRDGRRRPPG